MAVTVPVAGKAVLVAPPGPHPGPGSPVAAVTVEPAARAGQPVMPATADAAPMAPQVALTAGVAAMVATGEWSPTAAVAALRAGPAGIPDPRDLPAPPATAVMAVPEAPA